MANTHRHEQLQMKKCCCVFIIIIPQFIPWRMNEFKLLFQMLSYVLKKLKKKYFWG